MSGGDGINYGVVIIEAIYGAQTPVLSGVPESNVLNSGGDTVLNKTGADDVFIRYDYAPDVISGCPLCGSQNWK